MASQDRVDAVELFREQGEGQLVWQSHGSQREKP